MRKYSIHKIFGPTIQGEGPMSGVPCVFVRFSGCNMWDGRPETRTESQCPFCDTDFFSHTMMTAEEIIDQTNQLAQDHIDWVWLSGGEPLLQLDDALISQFYANDYKIAIETNGSLPPRYISMLDHVTVSPKQPRDQMAFIRHVDTLKILYPHPNPLITPEAFDDVTADVRVIQPIHVEDNPIATDVNIRTAIDKVLTLSGWRLSIQVHKLIGVE